MSVIRLITVLSRKTSIPYFQSFPLPLLLFFTCLFFFFFGCCCGGGGFFFIPTAGTFINRKDVLCGRQQRYCINGFFHTGRWRIFLEFLSINSWHCPSGQRIEYIHQTVSYREKSSIGKPAKKCWLLQRVFLEQKVVLEQQSLGTPEG